MRPLSFRPFMLVMLLVTLAACQENVRPTPPPMAAAYHKNLHEAIDYLVSSLTPQVRELTKPEQLTIPIDEFFSEQSAEVSQSSRGMQQQLSSALTKNLAPLNFVPLSKKSVDQARWAVLASYATAKAGETQQAGRWVRLKIALAEVQTGKVLARAETYLEATQFQADPTKFFKDAPMFLVNEQHKERLGVTVGQARPIQQTLRLQAAFIEAVDAYEAGRYPEAGSGFASVLKINPKHPGALTGLYQSFWQQGKKAEAEEAFSQLVNAGIDAGMLTVKLLFKVRTTDFIENAELVQQYRVWLKVIGQTLAARDRCLNVSGHASKSGGEEYNDKLSLGRAQRITSMMQQITPALSNRLKPYGKGFQETIVGNGADDASDAIDRRVEFGVRSCH